MIAIAGNVWEQIEKHNILKSNPISKVRAQTVLKLFTYNSVDLDIEQYISDNNMITVLRNIKEKCLILKPDKSQGIVLIDKNGYYNSMERLFNDSKFIHFLIFPIIVYIIHLFYINNSVFLVRPLVT